MRYRAQKTVSYEKAVSYVINILGKAKEKAPVFRSG